MDTCGGLDATIDQRSEAGRGGTCPHRAEVADVLTEALWQLIVSDRWRGALPRFSEFVLMWRIGPQKADDSSMDLP